MYEQPIITNKITPPFILTKEDINVLNLFLLKHTRAGRIYAKSLFYLGEITLLAISIIVAQTTRHFILVCACLFGIFQIWIIIRKLINPLWPASDRSLERIVSDNLQTTIEITPEKIIYHNNTESISLAWPVVKLIHADKSHLYIYWGLEVAFMVPSRAFDSDIDFQQFSTLALQNWKSFSAGRLK